MQDFNSIIEAYNLLPHPEGGFYKEIHRSKIIVNATGKTREKSAYTTIHYLLSGQDFSSWHRIQSDETWFFHLGCELLIYYFDSKNLLQIVQLGLDSNNLQITIPANTWFAARPIHDASFCLVSCAVGPGFEFNDFEIGKREELLIEIGNSAKNIQAIEAFTRG